jgi:hypothetical protein
VLDVLGCRDGKMFWVCCRKDRRGGERKRERERERARERERERNRERERARAGEKEREHGRQGQGTAFGPAAGEWATREIAHCSLG